MVIILVPVLHQPQQQQHQLPAQRQAVHKLIKIMLIVITRLWFWVVPPAAATAAAAAAAAVPDTVWIAENR